MKDNHNQNQAEKQTRTDTEEESVKKPIEVAEPTTEPTEAITLEDEPKSKKGLFAGLSISLVVLIAVVSVVTTIILNNVDNKPTGSTVQIDDDEEEEEIGEQEMDQELSAGGVTITVGGRQISYAGAYVVDGIEATISAGEYVSLNDNEAVFLVVNGGTLTIEGNVAITKKGSEEFQGRGDDYSFYGMNSAIVVVGEGSSVTIDGAKITTDVSGANAVVATGGGSVTISNSKIVTSKDNSRGLHATFGGLITAENVAISTKGASSASLATDRGEGTVTASKMTLNTEGQGSPLIYSTGAITVSGSKGTATGAQIAVVEGKNSITLESCEFSTNGKGNRNDVDNAGIMIYQSMSGDAGVGTGSFKAEKCTFTILEDSEVYTIAPLFFVTNTTATIELKDIEASFYEEGYFLMAQGTEEWGRSGMNGGKVTINAVNLEATNTNIGVDSISSVDGF